MARQSQVSKNQQDIADLRVQNATLAGSVEHLATTVAELTTTVQGLRDTMNRGRGALWGISGVAAVLGGAASIAANKLLGP